MYLINLPFTQKLFVYVYQKTECFQEKYLRSKRSTTESVDICSRSTSESVGIIMFINYDVCF